MKVLVFGNTLLKNDSIPLKLLSKLNNCFQDIDFIKIDPTEDLEKYGKRLIILDTVYGIKKVTILNSISQLHTNKIYSMHDFDLAYNLKLLKKIGKINSVKIVGIPMYIGYNDALHQIQSIFKKWAAQLMQGS